MIDAWLIDTVLKLGEILAIVGSMGVALISFGRSATRVELKLAMQSDQIDGMQAELKKLSQLMTTVALQGQRMDMLNERLNTLDRRYDELRNRHFGLNGLSES